MGGAQQPDGLPAVAAGPQEAGVVHGEEGTLEAGAALRRGGDACAETGPGLCGLCVGQGQASAETVNGQDRSGRAGWCRFHLVQHPGGLIQPTGAKKGLGLLEPPGEGVKVARENGQVPLAQRRQGVEHALPVALRPGQGGLGHAGGSQLARHVNVAGRLPGGCHMLRGELPLAARRVDVDGYLVRLRQEPEVAEVTGE